MIAFTVYGTPVPQGSMKAFTPKGWTRPIITSDNAKLKPWRQQISGTAAEKMGDKTPTRLAVALRVTFYFEKPKSAPKRVEHKTTKPDVDKLGRGVLDALTGICYVDDSQVIALSVIKRFGTPERTEIEVRIAAVTQPAATKSDAQCELDLFLSEESNHV